MLGDSDDIMEVSNENVEAGRAVTRKCYRKLLDDIAADEDNLVNTDENEGNKLLQYLQNNDELFKDVDAPQEAVMDAVVIKNLSRLCRQQAEQMSTNINVFKPEEYSLRLKTSMNVEKDTLCRRKWLMLGNQVKSMFRKSPTFTYMFGALDSVPPEPKEKKQKETKSRQATKVADLKETQAAEQKETESSANVTDQIVTHVFKCLVRKFKENNRMPINYFKFVINPNCFGSSIENMFHVSFLIKDGRASVQICQDTGIPVIAPIGQKQMQTQRQEHSKNQVVLSFNMCDWNKLIRKYEINETMINAI